MNKILILLFGIFLTLEINSQVELLSSIGLESEPTPETALCEPQLHIDDVDTYSLEIGELVHDFTLYTVDGEELNLASTLDSGRPVLVITASYTCPRFRDNVPDINAIYDLYEDQVEIAIIYTIEAHPVEEISPYFGYVNVSGGNIMDSIFYDQPTTYAQRMNMVNITNDSLDLEVPIYLDTPCNDWLNTFGPGANRCYLIDLDGTIALSHGWYNSYGNDIYADMEAFMTDFNNTEEEEEEEQEEEEEEEEEESYLGNFEFNLNDYNTSSGLAGETIYILGNITNPTEEAVLIQIERIIEDVPSNWTTAMCLDICLPVDQSYYEFVLEPMSEQLFTAYFYTSELNESEGEMVVTFTNSTQPENTVEQSFQVETYMPVSVEENLGVSDIHAYPNPCDGNFTISKNIGHLDVYSLEGKLMGRYNSNNLRFELDHLNSGLYIISNSEEGFHQQIQVLR